LLISRAKITSDAVTRSPKSVDGDAYLNSDSALTGEIRFHMGDDMPFTAKQWRFFAACS